jgi:alpha-galactosidase
MANSVYSSIVSKNELSFIRDWTAGITGAGPEAGSKDAWKDRITAGMPVSFKYGNSNGKEILDKAGWDRKSGDWTNGKRSHTLTSTDTTTGLLCTIEITEYADFPAVEWVLHFTNTSNEDSPAISEVSALDLLWKSPGTVPVLHHSRGSDELPNDFEYVSEVMAHLRTPAKSIHLNPGKGYNPFNEWADGRSSVEWLPFFNLQTGDDGIAMAIGWSGQWVADFIHDGEGNMQIKAGMEFLDSTLLPGESIRTPSIMVLYWKGEPIHGENVLRQFLLAHHTPQVDGKPVVPPFPHATFGGAPTTEHLDMIKKITDHKLLYDYYWIDAGWYGNSPEASTDVFNGDWGRTGDWWANPYRHPNGLKPICDAAHQAGMKAVLWVEPLRATYGTQVTLDHPEWFLNHNGEPFQPEEQILLDLGHPGACQWAIDTVSRLVDETGIDVYEEDFNYWRILECFAHKDSPGRRGISEIRFTEGLYHFWDELKRRYPALLIGNCASGGRRIDLESITRSLTLWRSDYNCFPVDHDLLQLHTVGISHWIPLNGTSPVAEPNDTYAFRSGLAPAGEFMLDECGRLKRPEYDEATWEWYRQMMRDYMRIRPYWYGDYYPLITCSLNKDAWMAYQLHHPEMNEGVVAAFRRSESPLTAADFTLRGLTEEATYEFEDADTHEKWQLVTDQGETNLNIIIPTKRTARLLFYRKIS